MRFKYEAFGKPEVEKHSERKLTPPVSQNREKIALIENDNKEGK